jgi:hypothetical protein
MTTSALGRAVRDEWMLDWNWLHVNQGSFGAAPRTVLEIQQDWRRRMEAAPSGFVFGVLPEALRAQAESLGAFIGAQGKDIVFVENATTGCNAVLRSLRLVAGDEILMLSHGYPAVRNAVRYVTVRAGARRLSAGGRRIRTRGPSAKGKAVGSHSGKHCRFGPEPAGGSAFRAAVPDWQRPEEAFRRSGTDGSNPVPSCGESYKPDPHDRSPAPDARARRGIPVWRENNRIAGSAGRSSTPSCSKTRPARCRRTDLRWV